MLNEKFADKSPFGPGCFLHQPVGIAGCPGCEDEAEESRLEEIEAEYFLQEARAMNLLEGSRETEKDWEKGQLAEKAWPAKVSAAPSPSSLGFSSSPSVPPTPASSGSGYSTPHSAASYSGYSYTACTHDGEKAVLRVGNVTFGGAAGSKVTAGTAVLLVDMAGNASKHVETQQARKCTFPGKFEVLREFVVVPPTPPPRIEVDWPDRGVPPLTRGFFEKLPEIVGSGHVIINCVGGHGRTGTALAALLIVHADVTAEAAITAVRKEHCSKSVESKEQVQWLCDLAGFGEVARLVKTDWVAVTE